MSKIVEKLKHNFSHYIRSEITEHELKRIESFKDHAEMYDYLGSRFLIWEDKFKQSVTPDLTGGYTFFKGGRLCPLKNILIKHLKTNAKNKAAIIWVGSDGTQSVYTYQSLYSEVVKCSAALIKLGIKKGDRVLIHLPNTPELIILMLACSSIGAVHVLYHASYSAESLAGRIANCKPSIVVTSDESVTGGHVNMKEKLDNALHKSEHNPKYCIIVSRTGKRVHMKPLRDLWYHDLISDEVHTDASELKLEPMNADDTMFMLYTSTAMGEPHALTYSYGGFLLWAYMSYLMMFDKKETDTYWCTADISWVTGHSYIVYGPLMSGQTVLVFEDTVNIENAKDFFDICRKYSVNKLYTTPSALRSLMNASQKKNIFLDLPAIEMVASGGEKMPAEVLEWTSAKLCSNRAVIFDIYSLTEAGGAIFSSLAGYSDIEYGTVGKHLPGVPAVLLDKTSKHVIDTINTQGEIVLNAPFAPLAKSVHGQPGLFEKIYWKKNAHSKPYFSTGDGGAVRQNYNMVLTGRLDDVMHIGGKRMSLVEIEEAVRTYPKIKDFALINVTDEKRGEKLIAFCVLKDKKDESYHDQIIREIKETILNEIGEIAMPSDIRFTRTIPKSPDGVILRDLLKEIAMQM
ncbi:LOW QUALITY PROTEIN: acetyl-CoA synthetase [Seleniivibrio woodruffii]|nr:LOW QUALITY PROTEIN: acetyl-CoA synthetase [Seleniivibrio woodruffii]